MMLITLLFLLFSGTYGLNLKDFPKCTDLSGKEFEYTISDVEVDDITCPEIIADPNFETRKITLTKTVKITLDLDAIPPEAKMPCNDKIEPEIDNFFYSTIDDPTTLTVRGECSQTKSFTLTSENLPRGELISKIDPAAFQNLQQLTSLNIVFAPITSLEFLRSYETLQTITVLGSSLNFGKDDFTFRQFGKLESIALDFNSIDYLPPKLFQFRNSNISPGISLGDNIITQISPDVFGTDIDPIIDLQPKLALAFGRVDVIGTIESGTFANIRTGIIRISGPYLTGFDSGTFYPEHDAQIILGINSEALNCCQLDGLLDFHPSANVTFEQAYDCKVGNTTFEQTVSLDPNADFGCCTGNTYLNLDTRQCTICQSRPNCITQSQECKSDGQFACTECEKSFYSDICASCQEQVGCTSSLGECNETAGTFFCASCQNGFYFDSVTQQCSACTEESGACQSYSTSCFGSSRALTCLECESSYEISDSGYCEPKKSTILIISISASLTALLIIVIIVGGISWYLYRKRQKKKLDHSIYGMTQQEFVMSGQGTIATEMQTDNEYAHSKIRSDDCVLENNEYESPRSRKNSVITIAVDTDDYYMPSSSIQPITEDAQRNRSSEASSSSTIPMDSENYCMPQPAAAEPPTPSTDPSDGYDIPESSIIQDTEDYYLPNDAVEIPPATEQTTIPNDYDVPPVVVEPMAATTIPNEYDLPSKSAV